MWKIKKNLTRASKVIKDKAVKSFPKVRLCSVKKMLKIMARLPVIKMETQK